MIYVMIRMLERPWSKEATDEGGHSQRRPLSKEAAVKGGYGQRRSRLIDGSQKKKDRRKVKTGHCQLANCN